MIQGYLIYAGDGQFVNAGTGTGVNAEFGCGEFDIASNPNWQALVNDQTVDSIILLIKRNPPNSGCTFSTKVWSAQNAPGGKVVAVLIADPTYDESGTQSPYLLMRDDDLGRQVFISSMFVGAPVWNALMGNASDGKTALWNRADPYNCYVEMEYYTPNPDGRVEMDLLYNIFDPKAIPFLTSFGAAARVLAYRLFTTPHFWVVDGGTSTCANPASPRCTSNCIITNAGTSSSKFYCLSPATTGLMSNVSGVLGLNEIVRQNCLFTYLKGIVATSLPASNYTEPYAYLMWGYWELFYANCANSGISGRFSADCSYAQMRAMSTGATGVKIDVSGSITPCVTKALQPTAGAIAVLDDYIADWQQFNPPISTPQAYVNLAHYYGDVSCRSPITESTCGPLSKICYSYSNDDPYQPYPTPCLWDNKCPFGVMNCTGVTTVTGNSGGSGVSAGAVVGIVIAFLVVLTAVLYYFYRKQQLKMKGEVDALLKQYLPMDPGATHGVAQGSGKMREQQERRLITDMDLEDQDMETRDDL